ncbi:hypothetical protein DERP_003865 [Dermatophagoides pteronyssinus]|uniref:Uncharacterized protein n=1 Tax=Dermatophagoides pteronyssinus TaxID=6956 RepID=A0ABQ8J835_DERPT|nr:hypothetical protein DERP_003865 [Dermatophagoides pteronyssinus]
MCLNFNQCKSISDKIIGRFRRKRYSNESSHDGCTRLSVRKTSNIIRRQPRRPHGSHSAIFITFEAIFLIKLCGINISIRQLCGRSVASIKFGELYVTEYLS